MEQRDYQRLIDNVDTGASICSFERLPDGSCSEIQLVAINEHFAKTLIPDTATQQFKPGTPLRHYLQDTNFEKLCHRCVSTKEPLHFSTSVDAARLHGSCFPLDSNEKNVYYFACVIGRLEKAGLSILPSLDPEIANAVLATSLKLHKTGDFTEAMQAACTDIAQICGTKKCIFMIVDKAHANCAIITEAGRQKQYGNEIAASMNRTPYEVALSWEADLAGSDYLILENEDDLQVLEQRDPAWYGSLQAYSVKNLVFFALRFKEDLVGFMWTANFNTQDTLKIKEILELNSFFIASTIANHQMLERLEYLSKVDSLTGVGNRNAMDDTIRRLESSGQNGSETLGIIYADLNGLKTINDTQGHDAGDKLLIRTAALLKTIFYDREIYRIGGDEFVVICTGVAKNDLDKYSAELKRHAENADDVNLAIGTVFSENTADIRSLLRVADTQMYDDKQAFYQRNPNLRSAERS